MPKTSALPASALSKVEIKRTRVDLPDPLGPKTPKISPRLIVKEILSIATTGCLSPVFEGLALSVSGEPDFIPSRRFQIGGCGR